MDFQVNEETYFLNLAEDENRWEFFVSTPSGPRQLPVYRDTPDGRTVLVLQEEGGRLPN
jgi:hypothetical protein